MVIAENLTWRNSGVGSNECKGSDESGVDLERKFGGKSRRQRNENPGFG